MSALAVFSGSCLMGLCGAETGFRDTHGEPLHIGDVVLTFTVKSRGDGDGEWLDYFPGSLTVVVSNEWRSYSNGTFERTDDRTPFVMGIKSVPMDAPGEWRVQLVKSHKDVIEGEHWSAYWFRYAPAPEGLAFATGEQP